MVNAENCKNGKEQYEEFYSEIKKCNLVQYDYRTQDGVLFLCVRKNLDECRKAKENWIFWKKIIKASAPPK